MMNTHTKQIICAKAIFNGQEILHDHALKIDAGKIEDLAPIAALDVTEAKNDGWQIIEFNDGLLTAGFIDFQVNGGDGVLLNDQPTLQGIETIIKAHRKFGTTSMLPTLISDTIEKMQTVVEATNQALNQNMPGLLGLHLEGPYFNILRKGVHLPAMIRPVDDGMLDVYKSLKNGVLMVTLAPEKAPKGYIRKLRDAGILAYAGHTNATYAQIQDAFAEGLSGFTHLFNAMSPLENREPGVVGAAIEDDDSYVGLILDNQHVADASAKIAIRAKKRGKVCLVTDAMPPVGTSGENFELYGNKISVAHGTCFTEAGTLAGSALDMATAVRNCHLGLGFSLEETLRMASKYPADALGLSDKLGQLQKGYQADIVHLDKDLMPTQTAVNGHWS